MRQMQQRLRHGDNTQGLQIGQLFQSTDSYCKTVKHGSIRSHRMLDLTLAPASVVHTYPDRPG